jgi:hypothetical protein
MVDLKQQASILVIYQKIKPQKLKTHIVCGFQGSTGFVVTQKKGLCSYDGLYNMIFDLTPVEIGLIPEFF